MHLERDGYPCDDSDGSTHEDQCYRGVCGGWKAFDTVLASEAERQLWLRDDSTLNECDRSLTDPATGAFYVGCPVAGCNTCDNAVAHTGADGGTTELITSVACDDAK